jgi:hypothetical protein
MKANQLTRLLQVSIGSIVIVFLAGCIASSTKMNSVSLGMSKEQVISIMGQPATISACSDAGPWGTTENLHYLLRDTAGMLGAFTVKLRGGKVTMFGPQGSFQDDPTLNLNIKKQ